jgi:hypothetical protein
MDATRHRPNDHPSRRTSRVLAQRLSADGFFLFCLKRNGPSSPDLVLAPAQVLECGRAGCPARVARARTPAGSSIGMEWKLAPRDDASTCEVRTRKSGGGSGDM